MDSPPVVQTQQDNTRKDYAPQFHKALHQKMIPDFFSFLTGPLSKGSFMPSCQTVTDIELTHEDG
jgi:hypothetical protein